MSPHAVNNFVSDLVLMAQAMERLPQVEAELANARRVAEERWDTIEACKADLEQSRTYAASLEAKVRETEASRDDAELRFLELDEKAGNAVHLLTGLVEGFDLAKSEVARSINFISPPAPKHEPAPIVNEVRPIESLKTAMESGNYTSGIDEHITHEPPAPDTQGQSEADPILSSPEHLDGTTNSESVSAAPSWAAPANPSPGPYHGKTYSEATRDGYDYISHHDWMLGGGSHENWSL